jgi:hypothetical protein
MTKYDVSVVSDGFFWIPSDPKRSPAHKIECDEDFVHITYTKPFARDKKNTLTRAIPLKDVVMVTEAGVLCFEEKHPIHEISGNVDMDEQFLPGFISVKDAMEGNKEIGDVLINEYNVRLMQFELNRGMGMHNAKITKENSANSDNDDETPKASLTNSKKGKKSGKKTDKSDKSGKKNKEKSDVHESEVSAPGSDSPSSDLDMSSSDPESSNFSDGSSSDFSS